MASSRVGLDRVGSLRFAFQVSRLLLCYCNFTTVGSPFIITHTPNTFSTVLWVLGFSWQFSGCGKSGSLDIQSHIPRIPPGIACVPVEVCSVFILPSVAPNPRLHTGREEKTKTFRKRTSPTSSSLPHMYTQTSHTCSWMNSLLTFCSLHLRLPLSTKVNLTLLEEGQLIHTATYLHIVGDETLLINWNECKSRFRSVRCFTFEAGFQLWCSWTWALFAFF